MKKLSYLFLIGFVFMLSCTGVKTVTKGLEDQSYIEILSESSYNGGVQVTVDGANTFNAEVNKLHSRAPKGSVYAISKGKHQIEVRFNGELLYSKQVFLSAQETKQIILP